MKKYVGGMEILGKKQKEGYYYYYVYVRFSFGHEMWRLELTSFRNENKNNKSQKQTAH